MAPQSWGPAGHPWIHTQPSHQTRRRSDALKVLLVWPLLDDDLNRAPRYCSSTAGKRISNFAKMDHYDGYRQSTLQDVREKIASATNRNEQRQWILFLRTCDFGTLAVDNATPAEQYRQAQNMLNLALTRILQAAADGGTKGRPFIGVHPPLSPNTRWQRSGEWIWAPCS